MAEDITPPVEGAPAPADNEPKLPSETPPATELDALKEQIEKSMKDGLIAGKFKTVDDMLASYQELEAKYANARRELTKEPEGETPEQIAAKQQEAVNAILPKFIENGMQLNDEMIDMAKEVGIDERDVKIKAYEVREAAQKAYSVVGGKENYDAMLQWGAENLSPEQKQEFDRGLASGMSEYAIKGLWAEYQKGKGDADRMRGNPAPASEKGYRTRQELFKDKSAAEDAMRRGDKTLWNRYQAKLALTPKEVMGI